MQRNSLLCSDLISFVQITTILAGTPCAIDYHRSSPSEPPTGAAHSIFPAQLDNSHSSGQPLYAWSVTRSTPCCATRVDTIPHLGVPPAPHRVFLTSTWRQVELGVACARVGKLGDRRHSHSVALDMGRCTRTSTRNLRGSHWRVVLR